MKGRSRAACGFGGQFFEERRGGGRVAGEQGLGHSEADAAIGVVVLAAVAAVGEVAGDGLALRLRGGGGVAGVRLDVGENGPGRPRLRRVAELRVAFDRPQDFLPRFVEAAELAEREGRDCSFCDLPSRRRDSRQPVHRLAEEGHGFLRAPEKIVIQDPQLISVLACPATSLSRTLIASDFR